MIVGIAPRRSRSLLGPLLTSLLVLHSGCIHTASEETADVELKGAETLAGPPIQKGPLRVTSVIYTPSKLPLEDFFSRVGSGQFTEAFKRIDLTYHPAKSDNAALQELLDAGFVPVYIEATNQGSKPVTVEEADFSLTDGDHRIPAVFVADMPREFEHFSPAAVGANVYNTGVVVIGAAAILGVLVLAATSSRGSMPMGEAAAADQTPPKKVQIFNETSKKTKLDYHEYLLHQVFIAPKGAERGLLFFHAPTDANFDSLRLEFASLR